MLAFRIWRVKSQAGAETRRSLTPILVIILDAGLLYSIALLTGVILFLVHSDGQYIVLDMVRTSSIGLQFPLVSCSMRYLLWRRFLPDRPAHRHSLLHGDHKNWDHAHGPLRHHTKQPKHEHARVRGLRGARGPRGRAARGQAEECGCRSWELAEAQTASGTTGRASLVPTRHMYNPSIPCMWVIGSSRLVQRCIFTLDTTITVVTEYRALCSCSK